MATNHTTNNVVPEGATEADAKIYILADSGGAVGAFLARTDAEAVKKRYPSVPTLIYAFPLHPDAPKNKIHILPYRQTNAVAFASNSRTKCEEMQKMLLAVGLTYEDSLDYWMCTAGQLIESGEKRLNELQELERLALDSSACAEMRKASDEKTKQLFALHDAAVEAALASFGCGSAVASSPSASDTPEAETVSILEFVVLDPLK